MEIADRSHQNQPLKLPHSAADYNLPIQFNNATDTQFLDLNNDCLYKIFPFEGLTLMDLCSVTESSILLKEIADQVFTRKHKCTEISKKHINDFGRILLNFGQLILELRI